MWWQILMLGVRQCLGICRWCHAQGRCWQGDTRVWHPLAWLASGPMAAPWPWSLDVFLPYWHWSLSLCLDFVILPLQCLEWSTNPTLVSCWSMMHTTKHLSSPAGSTHCFANKKVAMERRGIIFVLCDGLTLNKGFPSFQIQFPSKSKFPSFYFILFYLWPNNAVPFTIKPSTLVPLP